MDQAFNNLPQHYQVNIVILEGRHLALTNANTQISISIGKRKKKIHGKANNTDSPYYNDFCVFHFYLPLNILLDEILIIKVYQISKLKRKLVGSFNVELATIWDQPNHQFYHKWAVLADPKNLTSGAKGFLKCDIAILTNAFLNKPLSEEKSEEDFLEKNLLVPYGEIKDRHKAIIVFSVFRADSFSSHFNDLWNLNIVQPYVKITYGGNVKKTRIAKNKGAPVWNEELIFFDLFPPLCQSILIEICDYQRPSSKSSLGNTNIDIRSLYENGENGFLPTFGPNFLYLYHPYKKFERYKNYNNLQNSFTYMGRLLIAIRTEIVNHAEDVKIQKKKQKIVSKPISSPIENVYFEYKKFILFATIFDVLFFDAKYIEKNINIRLTIGPKKSTQENYYEEKKEKDIETKEPISILKDPKFLNIITTCNTTPAQKCQVIADYSFIAFPGKFPCVHVFGEWPDSLRRMYRSNVIKKVVQNFTDEVKKIQYDLEFKNEKILEFSQKLKIILGNLSRSCEVILLLTNVIKLEDTNLYRKRKNFYHNEIAEIAKKAKIASNKSSLKAKDTLQNISAYLSILMKYAQDPENSFPDTEIWLRKNNKNTAQCRIKTEDIAYSSNFNERGIMSGKPQTIIIQGAKKKMMAKIDLLVWFGLVDDFMQCLNMLPSGFKYDYHFCPSSIEFSIPSEIIYEEAHQFQCRAHIFQSNIFSGFDNSGLADAFIRVIILGQNKVTQVRKATLSPIWDETLLFPYVTLYGPSDYIKNYPVTVIVEVFDKEKFHSPEIIGRSFVKPIIKLKHEKYEPPNFPPKLKWEDIKHDSKQVGKILMVVEFLELSDNLNNLFSFSSTTKTSQLSIPQDIRPHNVEYRLEVFFWGLRQLKRKNSVKNKVFVTLECGEKLIKSSTLKNVRHKLNFSDTVHYVQLELPEEPEYAPPLNLKLFHIRSITSKKIYVANCTIPSINYFFSSYFDKKIQEQVEIQISELKENEIKHKKNKKITWLKRNIKYLDLMEKISFVIVKCFRYWKCKIFKECHKSAYELKSILEEEKIDWWIKYHASIEGSNNYPGIPTFKVYQDELEAQPEFKGFTDFLYTFNMFTGHEKKSKGGILMAKIKAAIKLYKWSSESVKQNNFQKGLLSEAPSNDPVKFVVRIYIICGKNLASTDIYGKSDPYLFLQLGDQTISDRDHYVPKQLNPTFGKCFEFKGTFPRDYLLHVKVIDYDSSSKDDLIGETSIDIENRYYSKHHATCGLSYNFEKEGFNAWRDIFLPTDILKKVCVQSNLKQPTYEKDQVIIEGHKFVTPVPDKTVHKKEVQALSVLHRWNEIPFRGFCLVPEHIETRSLYHPALPGIEQGKLEMWIDIFPADFRYMPPKVDISPQPSVPMELRAIVWNVSDVILDDQSIFFNEKMSDIYVRGWILSLEEEMQKTDVHYRSLNGEGNFNWRFIFHFNYIPTERKMTVRRKMDAFDLHPEERKYNCKLEIQIWDNDAFGDDYLGTLILELCSMPRGAKLSNRCTLKMLAPSATKINLFKVRKTRGWWPFRRLKETQKVGNEFELTGKIDLELEILTEAEAQQSPAGKGREEPDALLPPIRPATSFNWMLNPLKSFRYIVWKKVRRYVLISLLILLLVFFVLTALYAFPNYFVKKLLHA